MVASKGESLLRRCNIFWSQFVTLASFSPLKQAIGHVAIVTRHILAATRPVAIGQRLD